MRKRDLYLCCAQTFILTAILHRAPEVFNKPGKKGTRRSGYGKAADIYSWGIIAWQIVTRKPTPYAEVSLSGEGSMFGFLETVRKGRRPPMDGISPLLRELIEKCVHPIPSMRCSAEDIGQHLDLPGLFDTNLERTASGSSSRGSMEMEDSPHPNRRIKKATGPSLDDWISKNRLDKYRTPLKEYAVEICDFQELNDADLRELIRNAGMPKGAAKRFTKAVIACGAAVSPPS